MLARRIRPTCHRLLLPSTPKFSWRLHRRKLSSYSPVPPSSSPRDAAALAGIAAELDRHAPRIDIQADQIEVLDGPVQFYETLKSKIRGAKKRIYLSTLYIGKSEHELISALRDALLGNGPELRVSILTDALRGTRESPEASCASLLASLAAEFPDQVEIRMYHTPNLTGVRKRLLPKRINEGWGLQHIKLYGFDDQVILSGANLSADYFTNRQDRYHIFSSKRVADYYASIHNAVCSVSFRLLPDSDSSSSSSSTPCSYNLTWPASNPAPSPLLEPQAYIRATTALLRPLASPSQPRRPSFPAALSTTTTSIYPLLTHPPTINTELPSLRAVLLASPLLAYTFTAGYFNPHPRITAALLHASSSPSHSPTPGTILTASPHANGFYGSPGISGLLPAAYTHLSLTFLQAARNLPIQLREWQHGHAGHPDRWTYHAKGLWAVIRPPPPSPSSSSDSSDSSPLSSSPPSSSSPSSSLPPSITVIGSSNYTTRSYGLDLEVGALVLTRDPGLMATWERERVALLAPSLPVSEGDLGAKERRAGWRVMIAMWVVRAVGGAL